MSNAEHIRFREELFTRLDEIEETIIRDIEQEYTNLQDRTSSEEKITYSKALGKSLHDFYDALERWIFERIIEETEEGKPNSEHYHSILLSQMGLRIDDVRPPVLSDETIDQLQEFRSFHHLFRHTYGFDLDPDKFIGLAEDVQSTFEMVRTDLTKFFDQF